MEADVRGAVSDVPAADVHGIGQFTGGNGAPTSCGASEDSS